jgi:hypothetical protein
MGKRSSTAAGAATSAAAKKAKTTDVETPAVGNWVETKFLEKELQSAEKTNILKNDPVEILLAGPEFIPGHARASGYCSSLSSSEGFPFPLILSFGDFSLLTGFSFMT